MIWLSGGCHTTLLGHLKGRGVMQVARAVAVFGAKFHRTVMFVAFGTEEQGSFGSRSFIRELSLAGMALRAAPRTVDLRSLLPCVTRKALQAAAAPSTRTHACIRAHPPAHIRAHTLARALSRPSHSGSVRPSRPTRRTAASVAQPPACRR